jgi:hypothetical protein
MKKEELEAQFMQLTLGLQSSAWLLLGKAMNPMTGKTEKNLDGAKATIDTLIMLKEKTKGNLSQTEEQVLSNTIQQLELNYIEEVKNSKKPQDTSSTNPKVP